MIEFFTNVREEGKFKNSTSLNYDLLKAYVLNEFSIDKLTMEEQLLLESFVALPLYRMSRAIVEYVRDNRPNSVFGVTSRFAVNDSISQDWHYSYGELLYNLYVSSRCRIEGKSENKFIFSEKMIHCLLIYYCVCLNEEYNLYLSGNLESRKILREVMGSSITGRWTNEMIPRIYLLFDEPLRKQKIETKAFAVASVHFRRWLSGVHENKNDGSDLQRARRMEHLRLNLSCLDNAEELIQALELFAMFFTNAWTPQTGAHGLQLQIHTKEREYDAAYIYCEASEACFNVLNFVINSFDYVSFLDEIDNDIVKILEKGFIKDGNRTSNPRQMIKKYSLRKKLQDWEKKCPSLLAFPIHQFDIAYNIIKRLTERDDPYIVKECPWEQFHNQCVELYERIAQKLEAEDKYYRDSQSVCPEFSENFRSCPFVKAFKENNLLKEWFSSLAEALYNECESREQIR